MAQSFLVDLLNGDGIENHIERLQVLEIDASTLLSTLIGPFLFGSSLSFFVLAFVKRQFLFL